MSERFKAEANVHDSKNTRLPIAAEFAGYRFGRDALAHVSRYLLICEHLIARAKASGPLRILDVGCGDAYVARVLQSSFQVRKTDVVAEYVGLDIDDKSLARTEASKPKAFPIDLVCGDITDGGLDGLGSFDVLICTEVIEHVKPEFVPGILTRFRELASYGYISTPNWDGGSGRLPADHVKEWGAVELLDAMREAGIEVERVIGTFCQHTAVRERAKRDPGVKAVADYLRPRLDRHLYSLVMARFLELDAQNVLYLCRLP